MEALVSRDAASKFRNPGASLGDLEASVAARVISAAADIALVLDEDGVIRDLSLATPELSGQEYGAWLGRRWIETVTEESRPKVEEMLREARHNTVSRWREVNHPAAGGASALFRYSAVPMGLEGKVLAIGRDLRSVTDLQQRLVDAQQSMEREYSRLRQAETRYRLLFHLASEAVIILEAASQRIVEANPAAGRLLGVPAGRLSGRPVAELFDPAGSEQMQALLAAVRAAGRADEVRIRLPAADAEFVVSASLFRQENAAHFLVRLAPLEMAGADREASRLRSRLFRVLERLPDAFVVTGADRRILDVNPAFLDLTQLATEEQARGEPLDRWIGRPGVDFNVLMANLREHGVVRHFSTIARGEFGSSEDIEIAAVGVLDAEDSCFAFVIRAAGGRLAGEAPGAARVLPRSVEQMTELVGRVSLKELVRETTDVIERLCIEAALELTGDNRASAAQMLGLSRQSLYAKLRRYGLGDLSPEDE